MDPSRAYVHILTAGKDGRSPHPCADVLSVLRERKYKDSSIVTLASHPFRMTLKVADGKTVTITQPEGDQAFVATLAGTNKVVRFAPYHEFDVPTCIRTETETISPFCFFAANALAEWPRGETSCDAYVSKKLGVPATCETGKSLYFSETCAADAIELLLK